MDSNTGQPLVVDGEDFVACLVKDKKVPFKDTHFVPLNLERVKETNRRSLDDIFILFEFIIDKKEGKDDVEVPYGWFVHRLFSG